jgi:type IV pilus assembly protein PilC
MQFKWSGIKGGKLVSGVLEAESKPAAISELADDGVVVTIIDLNAPENTAQPPAMPTSKTAGLSLFKRKIKDEDLLLFTKKFSAMIAAGLAIVPALNMLRIQSENKDLSAIIEGILNKVNSGVSLSVALEDYPSLFDTVYVSLVKAGESSGGLDIFLKKISDNIQKRVKITRALKSALTYPAMLLGVAMIVIAIMMIYVVPVFAEIFSSAGGDLPGPTKLVMAASDFFKSYYMVVFVAGVFVAIKLFKKQLNTNLSLRVNVDKRKVSMPVFGKMIENAIMARFSEVLANLIAGGVNLIEAIDISKASISNYYIKERLDEIKTKIYAGEPIAKSLRESGAFPETFCGFVEVGEETGRLNDMLATVSLFYEDEFDDSVTKFSQMLEPMMIVFLGVVIGFILVAMYMPIFKMGEAVM